MFGDRFIVGVEKSTCFSSEGEGSGGRCYYELNVVEIAWQVYAILRGIPADISVRIKR